MSTPITQPSIIEGQKLSEILSNSTPQKIRRKQTNKKAEKQRTQEVKLIKQNKSTKQKLVITEKNRKINEMVKCKI